MAWRRPDAKRLSKSIMNQSTDAYLYIYASALPGMLIMVDEKYLNNTSFP